MNILFHLILGEYELDNNMTVEDKVKYKSDFINAISWIIG